MKNPIKNGPIICRRLQRIKDALEYQALRAAKMSIHEARALAADVARDRNHKDQWNAIKGILQMEGAFAEVELPNRKKAEKQLDEMLRALVEGGGEITATRLTVSPKPEQIRVLPDLDRYSEKVTSENHKLLRGELVEDPPSSHSHTD